MAPFQQHYKEGVCLFCSYVCFAVGSAKEEVLNQASQRFPSQDQVTQNAEWSGKEEKGSGDEEGFPRSVIIRKEPRVFQDYHKQNN